jgi:hypothetical protein
MLYIGHFSFDELDYKSRPRHGYFACAVNAEGPDVAADAFKSHILELREKNISFSRIVRIYIEDIIEFERVPETPVMTRFQSARGEFPESVSYSLPMADNGQARAYGMAKNVEKQETTDSDDYLRTEPFISFA